MRSFKSGYLLNTGFSLVRLSYRYSAGTGYSILGAFAKLRKATVTYVMSVRPPAWNISAPTGRILIKFDIWAFLESLSRKLKFHTHTNKYIILLFHGNSSSVNAPLYYVIRTLPVLLESYSSTVLLHEYGFSPHTKYSKVEYKVTPLPVHAWPLSRTDPGQIYSKQTCESM